MGDDVEYAKYIIQTFDLNNQNSINFVDFSKFMEQMWTFKDTINEKKCLNSMNKAKNTFYYLFKWLDRDEDKFITPEDMIYGISRIMIRDVDMKEVILFNLNQIQKTFSIYDKEKTGKLDFDAFMLAISNGFLENTFKDPLSTDNFMSYNSN